MTRLLCGLLFVTLVLANSSDSKSSRADTSSSTSSSSSDVSLQSYQKNVYVIGKVLLYSWEIGFWVWLVLFVIYFIFCCCVIHCAGKKTRAAVKEIVVQKKLDAKNMEKHSQLDKAYRILCIGYTKYDYYIAKWKGFGLVWCLKVGLYVLLLISEIITHYNTDCTDDNLCDCQENSYIYLVQLYTYNICLAFLQLAVFIYFSCCLQDEDKINDLHFESPIMFTLFCFPNVILIALMVKNLISTIICKSFWQLIEIVSFSI